MAWTIVLSTTAANGLQQPDQADDGWGTDVGGSGTVVPSCAVAKGGDHRSSSTSNPVWSEAHCQPLPTGKGWWKMRRALTICPSFSPIATTKM
jgi:hypothetical protein